MGVTTVITSQEETWAGSFGDAYTERQRLPLAARKAMFSRILASTRYPITSVIEFGAGTGENLRALRALLVGVKLYGVELNAQAFGELKSAADVAIKGSILDVPLTETWDITLTRGLLIHIQPVELLRVYDVLYKHTRHYVCICEYYNPTPVMIPYRGENDRLWKRDFAGELLNRYPNLRLVDYGFVYHRDPIIPQDDITFFLMEKQHG